MLAHEIRSIVASFRRRPLVPLLAAGMLSLGIGANVAVFTVISRTLLRPLPYAQPDRLLVLASTFVAPDRTEETYPSGSVEIVQWQQRATQFTAIEAVRPLWMTVRDTGDAQSVSGALVTGGLLRMFGVRPALGRDFSPEENVPDAQVAIISHGWWQRHFGGRPGVIGKSVLVDGRLISVIGVLPPSFEIVNVPVRPDIFIPAGLSPAHMPQPQARGYTVLGRLRDGVGAKQGEAELRRISAQLAREYPATHEHWTASVKTIHDAAFGDRRQSLVVLWLMVALVHVLACVNAGALLSAQMTDERGITALRLALGASRGHLLRYRLLQGLLTTAAGTIAGLLLGSLALSVLLPDEGTAALAAPSAGWWLLPLFLTALSLLTGVAVAILPALRETRTSLTTALSEQGPRTSSSARGARIRELFIIGEVALAVPLLLAASAAIDHFRQLQRIDLGLKSDGVLASQIILPPRYDKAGRAAFARELVRRLEEAPQIASAAVTTCNFAPGQAVTTTVGTDRSPEPISMNFRRITPGYFATLGIPLLAGRAFTDGDNLDAPPVMILSESLARRFFPNQNPIGQRIVRAAPAPPGIVVGVVPDVRDDGPTTTDRLTLYTSYLQGNNVFLTLVVRARGDALSARDAVRRTVWSLDRDITPSRETPLSDLMTDAVGNDRLQMLLLSAFGLVALVLACSGIYGMTTYVVIQRMREIGVRLAFGATPREITFEIVRRSARSVSIGLVVGIVLSLMAQRVAAAMLGNAAAADATSAALVIGTLFVTALIAATVPSARARTVQPAMLLRQSA